MRGEHDGVGVIWAKSCGGKRDPRKDCGGSFGVEKTGGRHGEGKVAGQVSI